MVSTQWIFVEWTDCKMEEIKFRKIIFEAIPWKTWPRVIAVGTNMKIGINMMSTIQTVVVQEHLKYYWGQHWSRWLPNFLLGVELLWAHVQGGVDDLVVWVRTQSRFRGSESLDNFDLDCFIREREWLGEVS